MKKMLLERVCEIFNLENLENTSENMPSNSSSGIYLRDDHCDWGSSGMNEFTQEFGENN